MRMRTRLLSFAATFSLLVMLAAAAAAQTTRQLTVKIPFDFSVGKKALPAGNYSVYRMSTSSGETFLLRSVDGSARVVFNAHQIRSKESNSPARVEFRQYGDQYFLAQVWTQGSDIGRELKRSSRERKTARGATPGVARAPEQGVVVVSSTD